MKPVIGVQGLTGRRKVRMYPAPFDRPFYMILNLAVGGDMPGNPKDDFTTDKMYVDYARVYKYKDVDKLPDVTGKRPESTGNITPQRAPMPDGNQIWNNKFDEGTDTSGTPQMWQFLKDVMEMGMLVSPKILSRESSKSRLLRMQATNFIRFNLRKCPSCWKKGKPIRSLTTPKQITPRSVMSKLSQYQGSWTPYSGEVTKQLTDQS